MSDVKSKLYAMKAGGVTKAVVALDEIQCVLAGTELIEIKFKGGQPFLSVDATSKEIEEIMNALSEHITPKKE